MFKRVWQKIKQNHLLLMTLCCLAPIVLIIGFFALFKNSNDYWIWLIILLCPILHIWMMKEHKHNALYRCSQCKLEYKEEKWAKKCEDWCKEHKSCNLEVIKHAVQRSN